VLVRGVFEPARFLDLVRNFVVFTDERGGLVKRGRALVGTTG
jgi:type I restriction enzyme, R subunit